ncbi:DNA glycosylase [Lentinula edodes]|uniref:Adenine DNA glycosylase n=1 Tax=Lentinula edodes TaxID=5353 RepID=A0A1Q3DXN5_LENED|nr:DNA glycosylase [Lentinula edodes]
MTLAVWSLNAELAVSMFISGIAEAFMTYRVWMLSGRQNVLTCALASICWKEWNSYIHGHNLLLLALLCSVAFQYVATELIRKKRTGYKRTDEIIDHLMLFSINSGLITSVASIACLITYLAIPKTWVYLTLCFLISRLYSNTFLCALNSRQILQNETNDMDTPVLPRFSRGLSRGTPEKNNTQSRPTQIDVFVVTETITTSDDIRHNISQTSRNSSLNKASPDGPTVEEVDPIFPGHSKSSHIVSSPLPIRKALLKWYATVCTDRGMPWRKPHDVNLDMKGRAQRAYEVWVSEVMLQQTQVATVIPYYNAWMKKFPTVVDLAESSVDEVNALWKGLGYYSRASRLLAAAQIVVRDHQGRLPNNAKEMEAHIPGIGRYSAGAISSIAYGERVPVVDGNVHRLFSRFLVLHAPPKSKATQDILWAAATAMVEHEYDDADYPGDINQALIELGSTICRSLPDIEDLCDLYGQTKAFLLGFMSFRQHIWPQLRH